MKTKCDESDAFLTVVKIIITGDDNVEECNFARSMFDENSEAFMLLQLKHIEGCQLGGTNTNKLRSLAKELYQSK